MASTIISRIPRGFEHLIAPHSSKFARKVPSRFPHPTTKFVQPRDRIKKWNIRPGDRVRMTTGKAKDVFRNGENSSEGWKVYTVKTVDLARNRVFLEGITNKKAQPVPPLPDNYATLDEQEKKNVDNAPNFIDIMRPVHYSNVQLCVDESGEVDQHVFASRIKTQETHFNKYTQRLEWRRVAPKLTGTVAAETHLEETDMPWPKPEKVYEFPDPDRNDTHNDEVRKRTLQLIDVPTIASTSGYNTLFPTHLLAPPLQNQVVSDGYLTSVRDPEHFDDATKQIADTLMPLHLSEELSPRWARGRQRAAWGVRRDREEEEKRAVGKDAVREWEAGGKDKGLRDILDLEQISLEGVALRPRTRAEVRDAAQTSYMVENSEKQAEVYQNRRAGMKFDLESGGWVEGEKAVEIERKRRRRERKERRKAEKMVNLRLEQGENMVVPDAVRA
ncbi:hypothetical protein I350_07889 [Cryptococcus amylolentus CBS 6273]|uniref:KOW domain-containing protein n=1 Tax=Cryptococcus amylolentus CBS 6273 TaxID=1296118 RepID=A0A1E3J9X1_9TREE|nr:hypothetical protein I350_07889 [Cryptococcus amylolentus CBS 6273]